MDQVERIIGRLEATARATQDRLFTIEKKIDSLMAFKWQVIGTASVVSILVSAMVAAIIERIK